MTKTKSDQPKMNLEQLKIKIAEVRLNIKASKEKNTNAHKALKKQIAQLLTNTKSS